MPAGRFLREGYWILSLGTWLFLFIANQLIVLDMQVCAAHCLGHVQHHQCLLGRLFPLIFSFNKAFKQFDFMIK